MAISEYLSAVPLWPFFPVNVYFRTIRKNSFLLPAIIYLATVVLYIYARRKLPETHGFSLGVFEWPIIILSIIWLLFELAIFRDATLFAAPWIYSLVMFGIGLIYFVWLLVMRPKVLQTAPVEGKAGTDTAT